MTIDPLMNLAAITSQTQFDDATSAFVLLELIAAGHSGKSLDSLPDEEIMRALDRASARMDQLEIRDH